CETNTGDGASILLQIPHKFFVREGERLGFGLPEPGAYAAAVVFLPTSDTERQRCEAIFEQIIAEEGQQLLGWRDVPTDNRKLGPTARNGQPVIRQLFIGRGRPESLTGGRYVDDGLAFERKLYVIRRRVENAVCGSDLSQKMMFYVPSLSAR